MPSMAKSLATPLPLPGFERLAADAIDQQGFWSKREQPTLCLRIIHSEGQGRLKVRHKRLARAC